MLVPDKSCTEGSGLSGIDKVLVTGAGGFVGRHLCAALEQAGKRVVRVSSRRNFDPDDQPLPLDGVGHVFHTAARTGIPAAWKDPVGFIEANTIGTVNVLDQCRHHSCGITFLSAYIYGNPRSLPIREDHSIDVSNPYALSKHLAEQLCTFYAKTYGLKVSILRLFNLYGPGQDERFLIPYIVRQALDRSCHIIEVMDLTPRRDYVYIDDTIAAILLSTRAASGSVFNVGSGESYSVEDVIMSVCLAAGVTKQYRAKAEPRLNEIDVTRADISALDRAVGWKPRVSFDEGVRQVVEEMRASWQA